MPYLNSFFIVELEVCLLFQFDFAFVHKFGRPREIYVIAGFIPSDVECTSVHDDVAFSSGPSGDGRSYSRGTGTCTACHCNATSSFPHAGAYTLGHDLGELYIAALREHWIIFQYFTVVRYVYIRNVFCENYEMWITHGYECSL